MNKFHYTEFPRADAAEWIHPVVEGDIPPGRSKHTAVVYNNKMVVFGGQEGLSEAMPPLKFSNKLHVFDIGMQYFSIVINAYYLINIFHRKRDVG